MTTSELPSTRGGKGRKGRLSLLGSSPSFASRRTPSRAPMDPPLRSPPRLRRSPRRRSTSPRPRQGEGRRVAEAGGTSSPPRFRLLPPPYQRRRFRRPGAQWIRSPRPGSCGSCCALWPAAEQWRRELGSSRRRRRSSSREEERRRSRGPSARRRRLLLPLFRSLSRRTSKQLRLRRLRLLMRSSAPSRGRRWRCAPRRSRGRW